MNGVQDVAGIIQLQLVRLISAYLFIAVLVGIVVLRRIRREKEIVIATIRMTFQLVAVGYILVFLFERPDPILTVIVIAVMEVFAVQNIYKRVKSRIPAALRRTVAMSMTAGTLTALAFFVFAVVAVRPWYDPRYVIPIAGMLIGNSMTGITLGVTRLLEGMKSDAARIEAALMMGATPRTACKHLVDSAFDAAILPTINTMVGMGIVFLPGMMTGQILSGTSPVTAIQYQIAIMLGITGAVSLTVILFVQFGYKAFFTGRAQLIYPS